MKTTILKIALIWAMLFALIFYISKAAYPHPCPEYVIRIHGTDNHGGAKGIKYIYWLKPNGEWHRKRYDPPVRFKPPGVLRVVIEDFAGNRTELTEIKWLIAR